MSDTTVSLLTPHGTGAIATVAVTGPRAWALARKLFQPVGKSLPEEPEGNRFWFGTLGSDEVVLAVVAPLPCGRGSLEIPQNEPRPQGSGNSLTIEVHCHGGRRVVRWVIEQFLANGCVELPSARPMSREKSSRAFDLLQQAPTLRTASILLDQLNGAFVNEVKRILALIESNSPSAEEALSRLAQAGMFVGHHLVEPWKVVVAGPPNVGKSSLINVLAGYQRSVVSDVAGTTRDAVNVRCAFDGWPFQLTDTAGLRRADGLEAEGIALAEQEAAEADLVVWILDGTAPAPIWPDNSLPYLFLVNKGDQSLADWVQTAGEEIPIISTITGMGIPELINEILTCTVSLIRWEAGEPVPYTPQLAEMIRAAHAALASWQPISAAKLLREAIATAE